MGGARSTGGTAGMRISAGSTGAYEAPPERRAKCCRKFVKSFSRFGKDFPAKAVFQSIHSAARPQAFSDQLLAVGDWLLALLAHVGRFARNRRGLQRKRRISSTKLKQGFGAC